MNFASDNWAGASEKVLAALVEAGRAGPMPAYGSDEISARVLARFRDLFQTEDLEVLFVPTGTAANALSLAAFTPPWGAVLAHEEAHVVVDECGAPEFYTGAKLVTLPGVGGKIAPDTLRLALDAMPRGVVHHSQPAVLSLTNLTECGTAYTPAEVQVLGGIARYHGLTVHMDGARFANAVSALECAPCDLTWRAGVDVLSFGGTKGGCLMAEAIVLFGRARWEAATFLRKRAGHLLSKHRIVAAQFDAFLEGEHWLDLADHANAMARRLADGFRASSRARLAFEPAGNEVFAIFDTETAERLTDAGVRCYPWSAKSLAADAAPGPDEGVHRFVASFATTEADVDALLAVLDAAG